MDAGVIQAGSYQKLGERSLVNFDKWPDLVIQWLYHRHGVFSMKEPTFKRFKAKAATFYRNKRTAPLLDQEAYLFQIDQDVAVKEVNSDDIKEAMLAPKPKEAPKEEVKAPAPRKSGGGGSREVDLHIESLTDDYDFMDNTEMLTLQLKRFHEELDRAIAQGADHITFIHGVGNGVLRAALQKELSKASHIQYFEDAMKEKFGFGATRVQVK
ncbi:MAG: Smr/MutS family protein [Bacteroidota bacterium]